MNDKTRPDAVEGEALSVYPGRRILRRWAGAGVALLAALGANLALGQAYPTKPIRIVTGSPGGGTDLNSRLVAEGLTGAFGQPVVVDNRGGAVGAGGIVFKSPADGYTLALDGSSFWIGKLLQDVPYDPVRDYAPISIVSSSPSVLAVHPTLPANSVQELIALAKSKPGTLNYSVGTPGSGQHLASELFRIMAGTNMVRIPYKGGGPSLNALLAGEVQLSFSAAGAITPLMKSGKVRALGVTSLKPSPLFPGLPTVASAGLPGYEATTYFGLFAPAKTPRPIIEKLNAEVVRIVNRPEVRDRLASLGISAYGSSPNELENTVKSDLVKWAKVIKEANIRVD